MNGARWLVLLGGVSAFLAVAMGAVGSHALADLLVDRGPERYALAQQYHAYHALALMLAGLWAERHPKVQRILWSGALFLVGIFFFSGVLYLRALGFADSLSVLVPWGGTAWLIGWLTLASTAIPSRAPP